MLNCFIFSDYDSLHDVRKRKKKQNDRIVNNDKEKYEINSLHVYSCYDFICKEIFVVRLSKNQYKSTVYTHNSYNMLRKKKLNINIASIFITLTEINNETHYVAKKIKKQKTKQKNKKKTKKAKTAPIGFALSV